MGSKHLAFLRKTIKNFKPKEYQGEKGEVFKVAFDLPIERIPNRDFRLGYEKYIQYSELRDKINEIIDFLNKPNKPRKG
jgi:hypothetical protein